MPTFVAAMLAGVVGWLTSESLRGHTSVRISAAISLLVWCVVFYLTRRLLRKLRDGAW